MPIKCLWVFPSLVLFFAASAAQAAPSVELPFAHPLCPISLQTTLAKWGSNNAWIEALVADGQGRSFISPTKKIGIWVEIAQNTQGNIRVSRVTRHSQVDSLWDNSNCKPKLSWGVKPGKIDSPLFTDQKLASLLRAHARGVILVWSPHMPYSLDAIQAMQKAAKSTGAHITLVLAAPADPKFAQKTAKKLHLPRSALLRNDSLELFNRSMEIHSPTALAYAHGKLAERILPGMADASLYQKYLEQNSPQ